MEYQAEDHEGAPELFLFLASTAHDMKNSISVLTGTLEGLLGNRDDVNQSAYPQLAQMLYQTKRLNDNLIQLLALYKQVGKPEYPFDPRPQHIGELVQQVASQAKVLLESKKIILQADFPQDMVWTFDEDLIIGMLTQAINNAVRYTHDTIRIAVAESEGFLEIRVEDNGAGFPQSMIEAGESAMSGHTAGVNFMTNSSGLGLYFASEVAKMHKYRQRTGSIRLENGGVLGGGVFVVRLP
ncbi:ATP-binding protein [Pseudoduganella ginsengisoli]|uniref:histidine kinase n=1 Tax=Pseudoduganella ginsengisoli TaxID=1462440 RepID=A0A6L6Q737_9BURK|nr:HAMP domain-containing sensor histidine kinase [Pseudoduganella ginsengisoli]MTW05058.1 sensor histidine kinase [Pseudoduganella ginsengisoli]